MARMRALTLLLMTFGICGLSGCSARMRTFEGEYRRGFEQHTLRPCWTDPSERSWWVVMSVEADSVAGAAAARYEGDVLYARFRGRVSELGMYGHLGLSSRVLTVAAVEEIRPRKVSDCVPSPWLWSPVDVGRDLR
jgi:hypothetical protein